MGRTMTQKKTQKSVIKTLKTLHDYLKAQKNISTRTAFLRFVEKASSENPLVRDFLLRGGRMGVFEADYKEIFDSGKTPSTKDAGETKTRADIIHAKEKIDKLSIDLKYSNTVGTTMMYMTQYFEPGICSDLFHGYVRLSLPIRCDSTVLPLSDPVDINRYEATWSQLGGDINGKTANDNFGSSVSLSSDGRTVAIGAVFNSDSGDDSGQVRVYQYSDDSWSQLGGDIDGKDAYDWSGSSVSLSPDGKIVAIGAPKAEDMKGKVRVYQYSDDSWSQLGIDIEGTAANDNFGYSVSLASDGTTDSTIVAIGAPCNSNNGSLSGQVRVYKYSNGSWSQLGGDIDGVADKEQSGYSVSLSSDGTIVAIGARYHDGEPGVDTGQVRVYKYSNGSWSQLGGVIDGAAADDNFGSSVSLSSDGTIVAIGAIYNSTAGYDSGQVRVYKYSNSSWSQLGGDIDGEATSDQSGYSVSLSSDGTIVAIGAIYNSTTGQDAGQVRVYGYSNNSWSQLGDDIDGAATNDNFGSSVSLSSDGTIVAIGAVYNSTTDYDSGQVRVYEYSPQSQSQPRQSQPRQRQSQSRSLETVKNDRKRRNVALICTSPFCNGRPSCDGR